MGLILGVCMLYMSYSNLHFYKPWLQINNPEMITWIRFLVRPNTDIDRDIRALTITACLPSVSDPEWTGSFCLVDSCERFLGPGHHIQV